jgi:hypothetical protein
MTGQVVSALGARESIGGVTVSANGLGEAITDGTGAFKLNAASAGLYSLALRKGGFIDRSTRMRAPGDSPGISVIPDSFDLAAFEEFSPRSSGLRKWRSNPVLVIYRTMVDYRTASADFTEYEFVDRDQGDSNAGCVASHLQAAIREMSGGALSFDSVRIEAAAPGTRINILGQPEGTVVALSTKNLLFAGRAIGYVGSQALTYSRGMILFNADSLQPCAGFESVRYTFTHELGHVLGYAWNHMTKASSIMGAFPPPSFAPTAFDRDAIAIIYQRPVGNTAPDIDPGEYSLNVLAGPGSPRIEPIR